MRYIFSLVFLFSVTLSATSQQINPVPDYIFRNSMSVGRNAPTDTSAYFSIGPRFGATRGFMPPMVVDTAAVTGTKRNGLLIYSIQRNSFLYWDSTGSRWSRIAANLDTLLLSTRAWRQKGIDSVASVRIAGSGTINRSAKFTASGTIGDGSISDSSTSQRMTIYSNGRIGVNTTTDAGFQFDVNGTLRASSSLTSERLVVTGSTIPPNGVYLPATNTLGFATNTTAQMALNASGNLAIGMTSNTWSIGKNIEIANGPAILGHANGTYLINQAYFNSVFRYKATNVYPTMYNLEPTGQHSWYVQRPGALDASFNWNRYMLLDSIGNLALGNQLAPTQAIHINKGDALASYLQFTAGTTTGVTSTDGFHVGIASDGTGELRQRENLNLAAFTNNTERMRIFANGRIGVNTTTDAGYQFDVAGSMRNTTDAYFATSSGRVGVGTTSPTEELHVIANVDARDGIRIANSNTGSSSITSLILNSPNTTWNIDNNRVGGRLSIVNVSNEVITLTTGRNMGLNVSNPLSNTGVAGSVFHIDSPSDTISSIHLTNSHIGSGLNRGMNIESHKSDGVVWNGSNGFMDFGTNNTRRVRIKSDGEVLINTTSDAGAFQLQVNGVAYAADGLRTGAPSGGTAQTWKLGTVVADSVSLDGNNYLEVEVNGVFYRIALVTLN